MNDRRSVGPGGEEPRRHQVCLVLGGGGARGLAHLGVLQVFEEEGIPIDMLVGTSAGSIAAAAYAMNPCADEIARRTLGYFAGEEFRKLGLSGAMAPANLNGRRQSIFQQIYMGLRKRWALRLLFSRVSIFRKDILWTIAKALVPEGRIEDCQIPLAITALDLIQGEEVVLTEGDVQTAVVASSSIPGFFPPVPYENRLLVDSGLINNTPVQVARRLGADIILCVNLTPSVIPMEKFTRGIEVIFRTEEIGTRIINEINEAEAHHTIKPDVAGVYWLDFSSIDVLVEEGARAAREAIRPIQRLVQRGHTGGYIDRIA